MKSLKADTLWPHIRMEALYIRETCLLLDWHCTDVLIVQLNISRDEENTGDEALSISLPSQDFKRMCKINELIEEQLKRLVNLMTARQQLVYIYTFLCRNTSYKERKTVSVWWIKLVRYKEQSSQGITNLIVCLSECVRVQPRAYTYIHSMFVVRQILSLHTHVCVRAWVCARDQRRLHTTVARIEIAIRWNYRCKQAPSQDRSHLAMWSC